MREGQTVAWSGLEVDGHLIGDQGRLLAVAGHGAHVTWKTGARAGVTELVVAEDITTTSARTRDDLADSLEFGGLVSFAVRETYDETGPTGVINAMASAGHLSAFEGFAEEALGHVTARIRNDPSFREVCAHLDDEEAETVLRLSAAVLIRDAFGGEA